MLTKKERLNIDRLIVGGLHRDDFERAAQQYQEVGYVLVAFILDRDGYHWKAIYIKNSKGEVVGQG